MDDFESKHNMIQMLLDLLKGSASDEVMGGMKAPEPPMGDAHGLELEKVKVMPNDGETSATEGPEEPSMADSILNKGEPAAEEAANGLEDEEDDIPAFASFLKRKK